MASVIDAHAHLWDRQQFTYDWLDREPGLPTSFLPEHLRETAPAIDGFVFVQADCAADEGGEEAAWVQSLHATTPELKGIIAFAALEDPTAATALEKLEPLSLVVGIRRLLQDEDSAFFEASGLSRGLREVSARGWTFDACVRWHQLPALDRLMRSHEELTFVLDHLGKPPIDDADAMRQWSVSLSSLAEHSNVVVKLSGLPAETRHKGDAGVFRGALEHAFQSFGPDRAMVGSDWPVSSLGGFQRDQWFDVVRGLLGATDDDWSRLAHETVSRVYALESARA